MDRRILLIAAIFIIILLLFIFTSGFGLFSSNGDKTDSERENILKLVKTYMEQGEYERALNYLDDILLKNPMMKKRLIFRVK